MAFSHSALFSQRRSGFIIKRSLISSKKYAFWEEEGVVGFVRNKNRSNTANIKYGIPLSPVRGITLRSIFRPGANETISEDPRGEGVEMETNMKLYL